MSLFLATELVYVGQIANLHWRVFSFEAANHPSRLGGVRGAGRASWRGRPQHSAAVVDRPFLFSLNRSSIGASPRGVLAVCLRCAPIRRCCVLPVTGCLCRRRRPERIQVSRGTAKQCWSSPCLTAFSRALEAFPELPLDQKGKKKSEKHIHGEIRTQSPDP